MGHELWSPEANTKPLDDDRRRCDPSDWQKNVSMFSQSPQKATFLKTFQ